MNCDFEKRTLKEVLKLFWKYFNICECITILVMSLIFTIPFCFLFNGPYIIASTSITILTSYLGFSIASIAIMTTMIPRVLEGQNEKSKENFYSEITGVAMNIPFNILAIMIFLYSESLCINIPRCVLVFLFVFCTLLIANSSLHIYSLCIKK